MTDDPVIDPVCFFQFSHKHRREKIIGIRFRKWITLKNPLHLSLKASVVMLTKSCVTDSSAGLLHTCPEGGAYRGLLWEASGPLSCQHGVLQPPRPGSASSASRHHGEV